MATNFQKVASNRWHCLKGPRYRDNTTRTSRTKIHMIVTVHCGWTSYPSRRPPASSLTRVMPKKTKTTPLAHLKARPLVPAVVHFPNKTNKAIAHGLSRPHPKTHETTHYLFARFQINSQFQPHHYQEPTMQLYTLLLPLLLFLISTPTQSMVANPPPSAKLDNETVYNISKALCWNCWAESIEFLFDHNLVRAAHWEMPLFWDPRLEAYARWWAEQRKADCRVAHSFPEGNFTLGENVFWGGGSGWRPADAVRAWAEEEKDYSYAANACAPGRVCGHYTQIVWRSTRRLGCARVVCDDGDTFMTCNYDPPGNYVGERPY